MGARKADLEIGFAERRLVAGLAWPPTRDAEPEIESASLNDPAETVLARASDAGTQGRFAAGFAPPKSSCFRLFGIPENKFRRTNPTLDTSALHSLDR